MSDQPQVPTDFANRPTQHWSQGRDPDLNWPADPSKLTVGDVVAIRAYNALSELVDDDSGWIRIIPSRDGSPIYGKFKFTTGPHAGRYIMVRVNPHELDELLPQLASQLRKVYAGILKPSFDHYYEQSE